MPVERELVVLLPRILGAFVAQCVAVLNRGHRRRRSIQRIFHRGVGEGRREDAEHRTERTKGRDRIGAALGRLLFLIPRFEIVGAETFVLECFLNARLIGTELAFDAARNLVGRCDLLALRIGKPFRQAVQRRSARIRGGRRGRRTYVQARVDVSAFRHHGPPNETVVLPADAPPPPLSADAIEAIALPIAAVCVASMSDNFL